MVLVSSCIERRGSSVVSKDHVLGVIVDQVSLLGSKVKFGHETSNSQLLNDLQNIELGVKSCSCFTLELVHVVVLVSAA